MKRFICMALCLLILYACCGCRSNLDGDVSFYYCRNNYIYGEKNGVILAEKRNTPGHSGDLSYLLSLYLVGPMDETLYSPIPSETRLLSASLQDDTVSVSLSEFPADMSEVNISLAFSCLAMTCMEITDAQQVVITCGSRTVTLNQSSYLLYDNVTKIPATEEPQ